MKKIISLILSATMLVGTASTAFAAENNLGDTLTKVTSKVKNQLNIGDEYTKFNGTSQNNGLHEYWRLHWENEDGTSLSVDANTEGKIMTYNITSTTDNYRYETDFAPSFPQLTYEEAKVVAQKFLNKVLDTATESVEFGNYNEVVSPQNIKNYYFGGKIKLNGLDSPIDFSIRVNQASKAVSNFSRSDFNTKYLGSVPSAEPSQTKDYAISLLKDTIKMKLEYTTNNVNSSNGENDKAVLRYFPISTGNYLVDAQTGKLINIDDLYSDIEEHSYDKGVVMESEATGSSEKNLSKAEQEGIDKLAGVLSKEKLDAAVRAMSEIGLSGFTLADTSYSKNDDDSYYCNLTYAKADEENKITRKYIKLDAKSAELISLNTNYPYEENAENGTISETELQKKAEAFLTKYYNENFSKSKLYTKAEHVLFVEDNVDKNFTFAQQVNGYFFPENAYQVSVNTTSGLIDSFSGDFKDVSFDSTDGIVTMEQAENAYFNAFETKLAYASLPKKLDLSAPEYEKYISYGYRYLYELKLAYTQTANNEPYAVDAKTGKNLYYETSNRKALTYSDVKTDKEILGLASYGIGFSGGLFQKDKELTQLDMVALLVSADGYLYNPTDNKDAANMLYNNAYNLGILTKTQRNDSKKITRAELVKTILYMSGYGKVADLKGIYLCSFKDEKSIPVEYYGYVAIAQGLGMVKGGENETFEPNSVATREQAAIMFYNFMDR